MDEQGSDTGVGGDEGTPPKRSIIRKIVVRGAVPQESWADVFRSFVGPAARMQLARVRLSVDFMLEPRGDVPMTADDQTIKAMREAARQLGLTFEVEE